jgi:archaeosine synthase beta-subunit
MTYPEGQAELDRWILERRPAKNSLDPFVPYAFFNEPECSARGEVIDVSTVFLTNRECPWRCLMCDLWKNTLAERTPAGAIPAQIEYALTRLELAEEIKLYNSGSFFDRMAVPIGDYGRIGELVSGFRNVIIESHPALIGDDTFRFHDRVRGNLEVAMGLETAEEKVLARLNKRMTLDQFRFAAEALMRESIAMRAFVLVKPPFTTEDEALYWACKSIDFAFDSGAGVVSLIPVRAGNGAMEILQEAGHFSPPRLETVEKAFEYGLSCRRGRVFVDLWDLPNERLRLMNLTQRIIQRVPGG